MQFITSEREQDILLILTARALKAIVILRGLIAERIIVKGFGEPTNLDNGQVDIWSDSKVS